MLEQSIQGPSVSNLFPCYTVSTLIHQGIEIADFHAFSQTRRPPKIEDVTFCDHTRMRNCHLVDHWQPANGGQILVCWKVGIPPDKGVRGILLHGGNIIARCVSRHPKHQEGLISLLLIAGHGDDITIYQGGDDNGFNRHIATLSILTPSSLKGAVPGLRFRTTQTTDIID